LLTEYLSIEFATVRHFYAGRLPQLQFCYGGISTMKSVIGYIILIAAVSSVFLSCNKGESNPVGGGNNETIRVARPSTKRLLHGIWQRTIGDVMIPYVVYDSVTSIFAEKRNYGYNFRSELRSRAKIDANQIWWVVGDGTYETWYWLKWSKQYDTLILSRDSLFRQPLTFVRDSIVTQVEPWIENISSARISFYPSINSYVKALAYADSNWYVLTGTGWNDGKLWKVQIGDTTTRVYNFPTARAMDIADSILWLGGSSYLEKRRLSDTTLLARYDLSSYSTGVSGLAVDGGTVYLGGGWKLHVFTTEGGFIRSDSTYIGLTDMMYSNGRLWGITHGSTINEIDTSTFRSIHTYYLADNAFTVRYQGIAFRNGKIAAADFAQNKLSIWEVNTP
jgi:hypothetical protein